MSKKVYQRYTPEFKGQALGLLRLGKPVSEVAKELQISDNLLYCWRSECNVSANAMCPSP